MNNKDPWLDILEDDSEKDLSKDESLKKDEILKEVMEEVHEEFSTENSNEDEGSKIPSLLEGRVYPKDFKTIIEKCQESLSKFPIIDYEELSQELENLTIRSAKTPTLDIISEEISKAQGVQDRLTEMYVQIVPACNVKKRYLELLKLAWMNYASGGSKDKREGEAASILVEFEIDYSESEAIKNAILQVIKNIESILHSYSRRITVFQIQTKNGDFGGRSNTPEINFGKDLTDDDIESRINEDRGSRIPDSFGNNEDDKDVLELIDDDEVF